MDYHVPVLLNESVDGLNINGTGVYVDLTFGGGGHSRAILQRLGPGGRLFAFDQDPDALRNAPDDKRLTLVNGNFRFFGNFLKYYHLDRVDGILADLGVSSHHFDTPERGFSYRTPGPLDMRMCPAAKLTAADVVNTYTQDQLARLLQLFGELPNASRLATFICSFRGDIQRVEDFVDALQPLLPKRDENRTLSKIFQAIRIEVNHEMDALKFMLLATPKWLKTDGRLVVISYHSLEDRQVKNFLRTGNVEGLQLKDAITGNVYKPDFEPVNRKVITPTTDEIQANRRARSAKLRIGRRL